MTLRLVDTGWNAELSLAVRDDPSGLRIINLFIKRSALEHLLALSTHPVQVITRYNLDAFDLGVNDIAALHLERGACCPCVEWCSRLKH